MGSVIIYSFGVCVVGLVLVDGGFDEFWAAGSNYCDCDIIYGGVVGVSMLYSLGGLLLAIGA